MDKNEVNIAFEILLEEIELVINNLNEEGAKFLQTRDYEKARQVIEVAIRLTDFREKVKSLQEEWEQVFAPQALSVERRGRRKQPRLSRGLRTPEEEFRRPILEALVELGGNAPMNEVLKAVEKKMKGKLNKHDYQPLSSSGGLLRWQNTAQWCRYKLVQEGLMKQGSPRGIWEISEDGRKWLELNK